MKINKKNLQNNYNNRNKKKNKNIFFIKNF